jgi:pimeloyl-ACP methyl ester carboxylesterase
VSVYGPPGAFTASVQWYRAGAGTAAVAAAESTPSPSDRLATPTVVLWPEHDPLFPREWSDRIDSFFSQARLRFVDGVGHYAPLEYPAVIAEEVRGFLAAGLPGMRHGDAGSGPAGYAGYRFGGWR